MNSHEKKWSKIGLMVVVVMLGCFILTTASAQSTSRTYDHTMADIQGFLYSYWANFDVRADAYPATLIDGQTAINEIAHFGWPENRDVAGWLEEVLSHPDALAVRVDSDPKKHYPVLFVLTPDEVPMPFANPGSLDNVFVVELFAGGVECGVTGPIYEVGLQPIPDPPFCGCMPTCVPGECPSTCGSGAIPQFRYDEVPVQDYDHLVPHTLPLWVE
jgi:hypothetical protein